MTAITGNTFPVKDQIKALGGKWNPDQKAWMVPDEKAEAARKLVNSGSKAVSSDSSYRPQRCKVCGQAPVRDHRGYIEYGTKILRSGECGNCYEERKMGY